MIIALTGEKLSGKTTAAEYFTKQYKAAAFKFSQPLSDILERLYQPNERKNLVELGTKLREIFGNDILAKIMLADLEKSINDIKIIDGLRYMEEHEALNKLSGYTLVFIRSSLEHRYARTKGRSEKSDEAKMSFAEFKNREDDPTEIGIIKLAGLADVTIDNTGSLEDFKNKLDTLVNV